MSDNRETIVVAMSGGVDSSVAAALLVEQGYDVIGVTLCLHKSTEDEPATSCCSIQSIEDAKRVASKIGIQHIVLSRHADFEKHVIDNFVEEYRRGHTPNPCVRCNEFIKFDLLMDWAKSIGASKVATGHYARIRYNDDSNRWVLMRGLDDSKDQTYALYRLTQDQLAHTAFPLGEMTKVEVRAKAEEIGLAVSDKPDSQEICFVPNKDYRAYLEKIAPELINPGQIIDSSGKVIGKHRGVAFYTIGQRKGLGIYAGYPVYVTHLDADTNTVVVGHDDELCETKLVAKDLNMISVESVADELAVTAKIRYNAKDSAAVVRSISKDAVEVVFEHPQRAVTPGQAVVFYQGDVVVGGATIADEKEAELAYKNV